MQLSHSRIPALDGIRGIAISGVLLNHFLVLDYDKSAPLWKLIGCGYLGVDLFFVLSGFLITNILLENRGGAHYFRGFYMRRVLRIFPLYYLTIALVWFMVAVVERNGHLLTGYDSLFWYLGYASNVAIALKNDWTLHGSWLGMNHFWSLAIEEQFYLLWPLLIYVCRPRQLRIILWALLLLSTPARYLADARFGEWSLASYLLTPCRLDPLAAGSLLALYLKDPAVSVWLSKKWPVTLGAAGFGIATLVFVLTGGPHIKPAVYALFFALLILLALQDRPGLRRVLEHPFLLDMGKYSYALYIFHHLLYPTFTKTFGPWLFTHAPVWAAQLGYMAIAFGISYGLARLSWRFIEQPILRLKDRFPY